jgi:superfamily II DNA or RNA helicase
MPKAVISNRIYLDNPGPETTKLIAGSLTYKFNKNIGKNHIVTTETVKTYKILPNGIISIPQARTDLIPDNYEVVDKRIQIEVPFPTPQFDLRSAQQIVYDAVKDTCFINALVGWGKTFTALHLARKFAQKTLVITHTVALRDQWKEEIETLYKITPGIIGGGVFDIEDHFIVVGNIQTLAKHKNVLAKEFGTIILDEAHHAPATTFTDFIDSSYARYRIALSGTMIRKDGKHKLFPDYFGYDIYQPPQSDTLTPLIKIVKTGVTLKPNATWVEKINELTQTQNYIKFIAAAALAQVSNGHSVLVIADRVEFLKQVAEYVGETCVLVTGETSLEDRQLAKEQLLNKTKMCVAGSRQIFSEGLSINILSSVILAIPMSNDSLLEQIVGRIQRQHPGKKTPPEVIDMQFAGWADKKQNNDRLGLYLRKGWQVVTV